MTIRTLAKKAGVSPGTVSKAFSGALDVSEETRQRIFAAAKEDGSFEKYYKGPLKNRLVGILLPEVESEYYGSMAGLLEQALLRQGMDCVVAMTRFDPTREKELFAAFAYRMRVDGVIAMGLYGGALPNPDRLPAVVIGGEDGSDRSDLVRSNSVEGVRAAIRLFKEQGHRRIAYVGEAHTESTRAQFAEAMRAEGLPVYEALQVTVPGRFGEGGYAAMERLLAITPPPTAVFAAYDYMALGAMRCARDHGLHVPEEISFAAMGDLSVLPYLEVPLTTVKNHLEEVCDRIVQVLLQKMTNRYYHNREPIPLRTELSVRGSVAPAPGPQPEEEKNAATRTPNENKL